MQIEVPDIVDVKNMAYAPFTQLDMVQAEDCLEYTEHVRGVYSDDGDLLALFGALSVWPGVAQVFMAIDYELAPTHMRDLIKAGRELIDMAHDELDVHRLQTFVPLEKRTMRFNDLIGMKAESVMEGGQPNKLPLVMYAHLKGVETWAQQQ